MKFRRSITLALAAGTLLAGAAALPAGASTLAASETTYIVPECVQQVKAAIAAGTANGTSVEDCEVTTGASTGKAFVVTPADIKTSSTLSTSDKSSMLAASATAAITGKHWSQFTTGGAYTRTQNGTFYYNGSRVWVTVSYSGYTGSHNCFTNVSIGFNLTGGSCNESGSTTSRSMYSDWTVNPNGTFIEYGVSMTAILDSGGGISGFGATVG